MEVCQGKKIRSRQGLRVTLLAGLMMWLGLSGMVCDRAADIVVRVKKDFLFQMRPEDALSLAGIRDQNGKVPDGIPQREFILRLDNELDLTTNTEFQQYKDRVKRIHINRVWMTIQLNNSPITMGQGEVALAPKDASGVVREQDFANGLVASTPQIKAGDTEVRVPLIWNDGGLETTLKLLRQYRFALRFSSAFQVEPGMPYPVGEVQVKLEFELTFVVGLV
ncbi:MAG: hypothetical protein H6728_05210 [Myxococcales bacterium]|nr:hypothetical protein [Myxococcales bacterium]MCB9642453.1 hypothetical protein [Myxococcales bacterium]